MTKRVLKKQQKLEKLKEKIANMSNNEYSKMQIKLDNIAHRLFGLTLIFFSLVTVFGIGSIFTIGTSLLPIFVGVSLASMLGICATSASTHAITNKIRLNSDIKTSLTSMEEIEEQQKQQTQEIIDRIKRENENLKTQEYQEEKTSQAPSYIQKIAQGSKLLVEENPDLVMDIQESAENGGMLRKCSVRKRDVSKEEIQLILESMSELDHRENNLDI